MMTCDNPRGSPAEGSKRSLPLSYSLPPWPVNVGALQRLCRLIVTCAKAIIRKYGPFLFD
jgi:hypothetical protein